MNPDERANALKVTATDGLHGTGMGFVALLTVLPLLFSKLGAGKVEIGVLSAIGVAGFILGQPLGMLVLGRRRRTKHFFVRWVLFAWTGTHLAMGAVLYFLAPGAPPLCRYVLLALFAAITFGDGMLLPIWVDWQGALFSRQSRGRAMGMIAGAWAFGQGLGSLGAGAIQGSLPFPLDYSLLFLLAAVLFASSVNFTWRVREPESITRDRESFEVADLWGFLRQSLRQANFRSYMVARVLLGIGGGAALFYSVHFRSADGGGVGEGAVIKLGALLAFSQFGASNVLGRLGDRMGHKRAVALGSLAQAAAIAVAFVGSGWLACAACFAVLGVSWSSGWVSHNNMLFETCPHGHRVAHIALSNALLGPFVLVAHLGTGLLIARVGVRAGIGLTLIPTVLGILWLILAVREPRDIADSVAPGKSEPTA